MFKRLNTVFYIIGVIKVKQSNWKFFVGIGLLLIITGFIVFPDDDIIGMIGVLLGSYNIFKGIRLSQGVQPFLIRKQKESQENQDKKMRKEIEESDKDK